MTAFRAVLPRFKEFCVATICCDLKGQPEIPNCGLVALAATNPQFV